MPFNFGRFFLPWEEEAAEKREGGPLLFHLPFFPSSIFNSFFFVPQCYVCRPPIFFFRYPPFYSASPYKLFDKSLMVILDSREKNTPKRGDFFPRFFSGRDFFIDFFSPLTAHWPLLSAAIGPSHGSPQPSTYGGGQQQLTQWDPIQTEFNLIETE